MKTLNKINIALISCTALLVGLMVFGVNVKIGIKPEIANAYTDTINYTNYASAGTYYEYTMTHAGSGVGENIDCRTQAVAPSPYVLQSRSCVRSTGSTCLSDVCIWKKTSATAYHYTMSHASGAMGANTDCRTQSPVSGYTIKSRQCLLSNNGGCYSDICLWQKNSTSTQGYAHTISHTGSAGYPAPLVGHNCSSEAVPGNGYALQNRQCVMSNDSTVSGGTCISDVCLWKATAVSATSACTQNSDCGTNSFTGSLTCQNNDAWQNYRTWTCNNPGTAEARCSQSDELKLKQMCAAAQACDTGGCYPETW